jgi:uncharacterized membrane protein HdeD (DUF308 family)
MSTAATPTTGIPHDLGPIIRRHWVLFLIQGIIMVVLGALAAMAPVIATLAVTIFAGWLFLIGGVAGLAGMFTAQRVPGYWWTLLSSLLGILVGMYLIWRPFQGMFSLTLVAAAYFAAHGIAQIFIAIEHRRMLPSWVWMAVGGVVDLLLAAIIISGWPGTADWTLGLLFGISLFMWGISFVMTAIACRALPAASARTQAA